VHRPISLIILGALAATLGAFHVIDVLLYLGLLASGIAGAYSFFGFSILGAVFSGLLAWIWFWAAGGLWQRDPQAWTFVVCVTILSLIFDGIALIAGAPFEARMPVIVLAAVALVLSLLPSTREALVPHAPA
jgi:hypothetical protein